MCGIVGRVNASAEERVQPDELAAATRLLSHRGPDGDGFYCRGPVGLGHRRLSIVDLASGAQPMSDERGRIQVVFNGEIYNHLELRRDLEARGYRFRTHADTEVLVHGYDAFGEALFPKLRGMFAMAVWDSGRQRLVLARDRVGIKPLYWTRVGNDLLFSSEVKSLFAFSGVPRELEERFLPHYFALRYLPAPDTLFRGIFRLEPGTLLTFERGRIAQSRYWSLPGKSAVPRGRFDEEEEADRLQQLLRETTRMHLMGEVPVGLFLSGGIDSTGVGWAMREAGVEHLKTFAVGFDRQGDEDDELDSARFAAQALGAEHRELRICALDFRDSLPELVWHLDEPNSDGACIPLMHLARRAREEVTVVLSGEGADELFGGYGIYRKLLALERARRLGGRALGGAARAGLRVAREPRVRKYLRMMGRPLEQHYFGVGRAFSDELLVETFGEQALSSLVERFAPLWSQTQGAPTLDRLLYNDLRIWLPDDLLLKADKMTMGSAIELRVPFLDHLMIENAWRLPPRMKLRGGVGKVLLRRALEGRIPKAILRRPKKGFPVPVGRWLRTALHEPCRARLLASNSAARSLLGARTLQRLFEEHRKGEADRTEELYALWVFEEWHRAWMTPRLAQGRRNVFRPSGDSPQPRPSARTRSDCPAISGS